MNGRSSNSTCNLFCMFKTCCFLCYHWFDHWHLYFFHGSEVEGGATTISRKIGEFILDITNWQHMHCFGEKALQGLGKHTWFVFGMHCALEKQFGVKFWMTSQSVI